MIAGTHSRQRKSLLYIEDYAIVRGIICSLIRERYASLTVLDAGTAEEGLELFRQHPCSLVLTDIKLDGMDGLTMIRSIRKRDPGVVVIFITGHNDPSLEALASPPSCILTKPLDCATLFTLLDGYLADPRDRNTTFLSDT
jgi:CheY-like chemotaxis protein